MLLLLLAAACHCSLPTPDPSTDPAMATHLQKMWDGCVSYCQPSLLSIYSIIRYNKALAFRREQLPEMDTRADTDVIVFNDRTFEDHIIDFDAILIFFYGSAAA